MKLQPRSYSYFDTDVAMTQTIRAASVVMEGESVTGGNRFVYYLRRSMLAQQGEIYVHKA